MKLKKGSLEAKRFMAKIRAMRSGTKKKATKKKATKKIGATKFIEKNEVKSTKPARTIQITRKRNGTFKKFTSISGVHKDTKSHNVKISVMSGLDSKKDLLNKVYNNLAMAENSLMTYKHALKNYQLNTITKNSYKKEIQFLNKTINQYKKNINLLKK